MDSQDLDLPDPKRTDLEQDRIVLEFVISQFRSLLIQFDRSISELTSIADVEKTPIRKAVLLYKIEQLKILTSIIGTYEDNYYRLVKEDSL